VLQSPANIRDMWEHIHAWFGEFLKPAVASDEQLPVGEGGAS